MEVSTPPVILLFDHDIFTSRDAHLSFNRRQLSFSGRHFPTVELSAAERHVGAVTVCFQEVFEDPSL